MSSSTPLFLFDIDGTIVSKAGPHHRIALEYAASRAAGRPISCEGVPVAGMLDRDILRLMLSNAGVADKHILRWIPAIVAEAQRHYPRICPDLRHRVCSGMRPFLARLKRRGIPRGLVTGNLSRIGWHKMQQAGLRHFFQFGAFAEMGKTRSELVAIAMEQARRQGLAKPAAKVYLVGDHLNDIRAARDNGIAIISMTTGILSRTELAAFSPDFLLDDIRALPSAIIES
ncbi:HAD family hydrolase [Bryobacter aggregatus]|uniref:HAD family hydrolase n=1 Tax=Bryobacter aggregatus TaxID=360054 RepID=UPI0004E0DD47|nr:HAD family hydrolase [Bryobacter aggregatus]